MRTRVAFVYAWLIALAVAPGVQAKDAAESVGDVMLVMLPVAAVGATLAYRDWKGTANFAKGYALTMSSTFALKYAVNAERPDGGNHSMPSAHTSSAFSGASFLQRRYGWKYGAPAYAAAAFTGWSRVNADKHHWEDVVVGAAIGIASTYLFTRPFERGIVIMPTVGRGTYALTVNGQW